ncbi:Phosphate acyltransferase [Dirofilaria immitis]|nr:Phosphate acyltransferase [Dirofilaria immitis]
MHIAEKEIRIKGTKAKRGTVMDEVQTSPPLYDHMHWFHLSDSVRGAFELLKNAPSINFRGYIEASEFLEGSIDVIVADGFVGNVMLKTAEATASAFISLIKQRCTSVDDLKDAKYEGVGTVQEAVMNTASVLGEKVELLLASITSVIIIDTLCYE